MKDLSAKLLNRGKIITYLANPDTIKAMEIDSIGIKGIRRKKRKLTRNWTDTDRNGTMEPNLARKLKSNGKIGAKSSRRNRKLPGHVETVSSQRSIYDFSGRVKDSGLDWMETWTSQGVPQHS